MGEPLRLKGFIWLNELSELSWACAALRAKVIAVAGLGSCQVVLQNL